MVIAKGNPDEIRRFVQDAVDHGVIDPPAVQGNDQATWRTAWKQVIEQWMEHVDVSCWRWRLDGAGDSSGIAPPCTT